VTKATQLRGAERITVRQEMRHAYEVEGLTVAQVAERFGRSYGNAHKLLHEAGTVMRPQGTPDGR
jgi:DNA-directed RNA polymerase specialized sigma24 family protein